MNSTFHSNATSTFIYENNSYSIFSEDQIIDPDIPSDCLSNFLLPKHIYNIGAYYPQVWVLAQCFQLERNGIYDVNRTLFVPPN